MSAPAAGGTALHTAVDSNMRDSVRVLVEECGARLIVFIIREYFTLHWRHWRDWAAEIKKHQSDLSLSVSLHYQTKY